MPLTPVAVEKFSGLNLVDDPGEIGWSGALDILNVDVLPGRLQTRSTEDSTGYSASTVSLRNLVPFYAANTLLGLGYGATFVISRTDTGANLLSTAAAGAGVTSWTLYGDPSNQYAYVAYGVSNSTRGLVQRVTSGLAVAATVGKPLFLATTNDNRLVQAGFFGTGADAPTGVGAGASTVYFSDAGAPDTYSTNNFINLDPGDGEAITGAVRWRELLFIFKQTKAYVFYGTSIDGGGNPVFNYRSISLPYPRDTVLSYTGTVAAGPDGVYFATTRGIMRTSGDQPVLVSPQLTPIFTGINLPSFFSGTALTTMKHLSWVHNKLYVGYADGAGGDYTLVYDREVDVWTLWDIATTKVVGWGASGNRGSEIPVLAKLTNKPWGLTGVQATSPTSRYRSGFSDLGTPDKKRIREWILEGSGTPTFKHSYDFGSLDTGQAVTLGTSPAVDEGRRRTAVKGRNFSYQLSGTSAWSVNNVVAHVADKKLPGDT